MSRGSIAVLLAAALALCAFGCGGDDPEPAPDDGSAVSTAFAEELVERYEELGALLAELSQADSRAEFEALSDDLRELGASSDELEEGEGTVGGDLERANENLRDASELAGVTAELLALAEGSLAEDREPSEEAQRDLLKSADSIGDLGPIRSVEKLYSRGIASIEDSIATTEGTLDLSDEDAESLAALSERNEGLAEEASASLKDFRALLAEKGSELRDRAEELAPDVVLDCTSQYNTVTAFSVRNMECAEAEPLILDAIPVLAPSFTVGEFSCSILGEYGPPEGPILGAENIRCVSGDRAFRFSFAD